jgi:hypothetical protein
METIKSINNELLKMAKKEIASCEGITDKKIALNQIEEILLRSSSKTSRLGPNLSASTFLIEPGLSYYREKFKLILKNPQLAGLKNLVKLIRQLDAIYKSDYSVKDLGMLTENFLKNKKHKPFMYIWAKKTDDLLFSGDCEQLFSFFDAWEKLKKINYLINLDQYHIDCWIKENLFDFSKNGILIPQLSALVEKYNYNLLYKMALGMHLYHAGQFEKAISILRGFVDNGQSIINEKAYISEKNFVLACRYLVLAYHKQGRQDMAFKSLDLLEPFEQLILSMGMHLNAKHEEKAKGDFDLYKNEIILKLHQFHLPIYKNEFPELISFIHQNLKESNTNQFYCKATPKTPGVNLKPLPFGNIEISGRMIPENPNEFFAPLIHWLDFYFELRPTKTQVQLAIVYDNKPARKVILRILKLILNYAISSSTNLVVNWYYESDDEDQLEEGEDYFEFLKYDIGKKKHELLKHDTMPINLDENLFKFNLIPVTSMADFEYQKKDD